MTLHGVAKKDVDKAKYDFEKQFKTEEEKTKDVRISISDFQMMGLKIGKKNTTKIIRK